MADKEQQAGPAGPGEGAQREETEPGAPSLGATSAAQASAARGQAPGGGPGRTPFDDLSRENPTLAQAKLWVQENQLTALLGAFAVGALIGVMMRR